MQAFSASPLHTAVGFSHQGTAVLQAGYSSLTITASDTKKVKSWVKKDNDGSFKETGGGNDRQK